MSSVPVRLRLTFVFTVATALVLAVVGLLVYARVADDLSRALDDQLRLRAQDVAALVRRGGTVTATPGTLIEHGETFAELLSADGKVVQSTPPLGTHMLLRPSELAAARRGPLFTNRSSVPGLDEGARLLAVPVGEDVLVVGATRENRAETLGSLRAAFLVGGPLALLLAAVGGYLVAGAALRPVEEAFARERRFVADASHELRTPLALLRTELELALRRERSREELEAALKSAAGETERLVRLADDLLLLASADQGSLPLQLEPCDAVDVLERVASRFAATAGSLGRPIVVERGGDVVVQVDRLRVEQAIGNLVANALAHGRGRVTLVASRHDGRTELHVRDEGDGLSQGFSERAFERFARADESRAGSGSGLGLAIVETIARAHGGSAGVAGADFWISLPDPVTS